jgi:16S rRNA processing protein RimM
MAEASEIPDGFAAIARIIGAWGVRGEVKAEPMAPAEVLTAGRAVGLAGREATLERVAFADRYVRIKFTGISDREAAAELTGRYVLVDAESLPPLPEDQYYRFQVLGMRVVSTEGDELGSVEDVFSTRENDVYVVRGADREILLPAIDDVVVDIDIESRTMTVEVIPGLLP